VNRTTIVDQTLQTCRPVKSGSFLAAVLVFVLCCVPGSLPAEANPPVLSLCPTTVVHTCVIGYVSAPDRLVVVLSSKDNDPLVGDEVEAIATPPGSTASLLDLSAHIGSVVMLDAVGADRLYSAKLVSVADPLLTALYLSMYMQPVSNDGSAQ
jgi:hypothetical protein